MPQHVTGHKNIKHTPRLEEWNEGEFAYLCKVTIEPVVVNGKYKRRGIK